MNSFWRMVARGALALMVLLGVAGATRDWAASARKTRHSRKDRVLGGPKEHGAPGRHEYERDLTGWPGNWSTPQICRASRRW